MQSHVKKASSWADPLSWAENWQCGVQYISGISIKIWTIRHFDWQIKQHYLHIIFWLTNQIDDRLFFVPSMQITTQTIYFTNISCDCCLSDLFMPRAWRSIQFIFKVQSIQLFPVLFQLCDELACCKARNRIHDYNKKEIHNT